jgi:hypothetical protein
MCLAVIGLAMGLGYSTSQALPGVCAVEVNVHPGARILLNHRSAAQARYSIRQLHAWRWQR